MICRLLLSAAGVLAFSAAHAAPPSGYVVVAEAERVPADILYAVACAESGRRMPDGNTRPWPWALNVAGVGRWYPTRAAAYDDLRKVLDGDESVDIGLGQINWRWHRETLVSPWLALDPYFNLIITARLLRHEFERCGCRDWWVAVERYHAPSDSSAAIQRRQRYRERVQRCWNIESALD